MRAPIVRRIACVVIAFSVLLVARAGSAQVVSPAPVGWLPASPPQTVWSPSPPSTVVAGVGHPYPTAVTTYYVAPVLPPPNVVQYYPQYEVREGPIRSFFRQLFEPLSAVGGFGPPPTVAVARPVALAPAYSAPSYAAAAPPSLPATVLKPPLMTTYSTPGSHPPIGLSSAGYATAPPPVAVMYTAPGSYGGFTQAGSPVPGAPAPTAQLGIPAVTDGPSSAAQSRIPVMSAPPAAPSYPRSVKPNVRIQYNEQREDLPSTSLRDSHEVVMQAAHLREATSVAADEVAMNQPHATGSDPPDTSGWRSVP